MRFSWESMGKSMIGTCADASQRARVRNEVDGWYASVKCGVSAVERVSGPFADVGQARRWVQRAADELRGAQQEGDDRIVYLVITEPGGVDGRDHTAKGGEIVFATFDKGQAMSRKDGWTRVESRVIDVVEARKQLLRKLSALDRLLLAAVPESSSAPAGIGRDLLEGNRG